MACLWNCYMSAYWQGCSVSPTQLSVLSLGPECLHLHRRNGIHYRSIAGRTKSCRACEFMRTMWSKWKCLCASEWDRQCGAYDEQFHYCWFVEPAHIQDNQRAGCTCCLCYLSYFISKYNTCMQYKDLFYFGSAVFQSLLTPDLALARDVSGRTVMHRAAEIGTLRFCI